MGGLVGRMGERWRVRGGVEVGVGGREEVATVDSRALRSKIEVAREGNQLLSENNFLQVIVWC